MSAEGLRDGVELVPALQTSLCNRAEPLWPYSIFKGGSVAAGGAALPAASAQTGVVVSSGGGRDGLTACLSSNRPGRDDSIIISGMK